MRRLSNPVLVITLLLVASLPAQRDEPKPVAQQPAKIEKLEAWPGLGKQERDRLLACVKQYRKKDQKLHEGAHNRLVAIGAAGMPLLMQRVTDRPNNINGHLFAVMDQILEPQHAALMARETLKPKVELRRYLIKRLCHFRDPDMLPMLQATMKDKEPDIAFYAALGAFALEQRRALPMVIDYSKSRWTEVGGDIAGILPEVRSMKVGTWVFEAIAEEPVGTKAAGLRLARYVATDDHHVILRNYLQATDHTVKKEAVNALRVMHGQEPLEKLSVFQVIGMAKDWLEKI